jgi:hypothetical protein
MARDYLTKTEKAKAEAAERRRETDNRIGWLERHIEWLIDLGERFKARDYAPHVVESLVRTNDAIVEQHEKELAGLRRATI